MGIGLGRKPSGGARYARGGHGDGRHFAPESLERRVLFAGSFDESVVFSNLAQPTVVRFAPDGRVFVAEKSGIIKVFDGLSDATPTVFADLRTQVHNYWDRGLLGLALHPQFPAQPYVYVLYTYDGDVGLSNAPKYGTAGATTDPGPDGTGAGAKVSGRLSRLTMSGGVMSGAEQVLVHDWAQQFPSHSIGSLQFGPDGALYASAGDGASFNYADYGQTGNPFGDPGGPAGANITPPSAEGGALRSQDLRTPGDATTLDGSIIRVDPNTGAALPTNPLYNTGNDANARRIIAHGLRNPFRFAVRPGTSELWIGDVGWNAWEEINRVTVPNDAAVENFGWPAYEGAGRQGGYDAANLTLLENLYAAGPAAHNTPHYAYAHSAQVVAGSGEPTGGSSISGIAFYNGGTYPAEYQGALFFSDYTRDRIYVMYPGASGTPDPANRAVFVGPAQNPVHLETGPGGDLFYVDHAGSIRRISYASTNQPPTAVAQASPSNGPAPLTVSYSAADSTDADGDALSYAWDLDGDGAFDDSAAVNPSWTYSTGGNVTVSLRVTDSLGQADTDTLVVSVNNTPPAAVIDLPLLSTLWRVGDVISFGGHADDAEQGALPASAMVWSLVLMHGNPGSPGFHEHPIQQFAGVASGSFFAPDHEFPSHLELRLTATDAGGLSHTTTHVLNPQTVGVTVGSSPAGLQLAFNGSSAVTPFTRTVIVGSNNTVSAPSPQNLGGVDYAFASWSDGGAQTHNLTAPAAGATYTASYAAAALPAPWVTADVGAVAAAGSASASGGVYAVRGSGADIWNGADEFRYVYRTLTGDGQVVARVTGVGNTDGWAKAGVMVRETLADNSRHALMALTPGNGAAFQYRAASGGVSTHVAGGAAGAPMWSDLVRTGATLSGYRSADGVNWTLVGSATVSMAASVQVGLAVTSHNDGALSTATFDNVAFAAAPAFGTARINFQPASSPVYAGYLVDGGATYAARNGRIYGWNLNNAATARDRNSSRSPDQRYDTIQHMQKVENPNAVWEIAVPSGRYTVRVVAGDASNQNSVYRINAEGVLAVTGTPTSTVRWFDRTVTVSVTDGRLTISNGSGASNNKICFIEIAAAPVTTAGTLSLSASANTSDSTPVRVLTRAQRRQTVSMFYGPVGLVESGKDAVALKRDSGASALLGE